MQQKYHTIIEPRHAISINVVCVTSKAEYSMTVKPLTGHHLEFLSLKGGCTGSYESTLLLEITCNGSYTFLCSFSNHREIIIHRLL